MRLRNNLFAAAFDYLKREKGIKTQKRLAELMGVSEDTITRILKDRCEVTEDIITKLQTASGCIFNLQWLRGEDSTHMLIEDMVNEPPAPQPEIPDFIQKLFDEAVRMQPRNELLERQCENLIAELRDTKSKNEDFLSELRKSKEDNDAMVAELRISYEQNKALISELRETRNENRALTEKLEEAIDSIEGMKNQIAMMAGAYNTAQQPTFAPSLVNDKVFPEGFIRGGHTAITEELIQKAAEILQPKSKRK
jgi:transcriptional regulator with XRE-family HTH domain